jgi:hypothetical protein
LAQACSELRGFAAKISQTVEATVKSAALSRARYALKAVRLRVASVRHPARIRLIKLRVFDSIAM